MKNTNSELCRLYLQSAKDDKVYYDIFFQMCRKFHIDWANASEKEKAFIEEVVRVTYERDCAEREGRSTNSVHPAFTA